MLIQDRRFHNAVEDLSIILLFSVWMQEWFTEQPPQSFYNEVPARL